MTVLSEKAHRLLAAQKRRYIQSMPAKREVIAQCMARFDEAMPGGESVLCEQLSQQVHRLAGSAGSYGLEQLGRAASVADRYLVAHSPQPADLTELRVLLQKLLDEIDVIIRDHDC